MSVERGYAVLREFFPEDIKKKIWRRRVYLTCVGMVAAGAWFYLAWNHFDIALCLFFIIWMENLTSGN
jgi:hypothetical protein